MVLDQVQESARELGAGVGLTSQHQRFLLQRFRCGSFDVYLRYRVLVVS